MPQIRFRLGLRLKPRWRSSGTVYSPKHPGYILGVLLIRGGKGKEDRGWEGGGKGKEKGTWEGERGRREGRGSLGRGKKGGKGNGGDESPAWSYQDLGSTAKLTAKKTFTLIHCKKLKLLILTHISSLVMTLVMHCMPPLTTVNYKKVIAILWRCFCLHCSVLLIFY